MKIAKGRCNGKEDPMGTGTSLLFQWQYSGEGLRDEVQSAYQVQITTANEEPVWDSGRIESRAMQQYCTAENGIRPGTMYLWTLTVWAKNGETETVTHAFETAIDDLAKAPWIGCGVEDVPGKMPSAPLFQKTFTIQKELAYARAYVTGLGLIYCTCNDAPVNTGYLQPPVTRYDKQTYFETFDITDTLEIGENTFAVLLGGGYNGDYSKWGYRYHTPKGLRAAIVLTYADGTSERIESDATWTWQASPITANGLYLGEEYDARWQKREVHPAVVESENAPAGKLLPDEMPPLTETAVLSPVSSWETPEGTVYDFGKIVQGVCQIEVEADTGCAITLHYAEMIHPDGTLDKFTNRAARAIDKYTCAGIGMESYTPHFTYHGFRYVLMQHSTPIESFRIHALYISADVDAKSDFQCSEPIVNRIHALCTNSIRANLVTIPTDCPVRDERTPCLMDSQMYEMAAMYNFDMYAYYRKWMADIAVDPTNICNGNMDWSGDGLMLLYRMYRFYGETKLVQDLYPHLKKAMENWLEKAEDGVWTDGFGDWCLPNDNTWDGYHGCPAAVNTSLLHAYTGIMAELAESFGTPADKAEFLSMGETVRGGFIKRFWHEDGTVGAGRQPEMFLPLYYGILTGEKAEKTKKALIAKVRQDGHFDTGGFSTRTVIPVLADADALDLFMDTVRKNHYPGFGYWNSMGATTLWEQYASKGNMHSHSHAMHAGIEAALFQTICGIVPTTPGFGTFTIAPKLPKELHFAGCHLDTYAGEIDVWMEKFTDSLTLSCTIPPNTEADLTFPDMDSFGGCVLFDGERRIEKAKTLHLGSGRYIFRLVPETYLTFEPYKYKA